MAMLMPMRIITSRVCTSSLALLLLLSPDQPLKTLEAVEGCLHDVWMNCGKNARQQRPFHCIYCTENQST